MDALFQNGVGLPLLVFVAELCVVTCGTLRIIFVARGMKLLAVVLGSMEILLWLFAIGQIMRNLDNLGCFLGFAAGFVCGNYLGMQIESALALGKLVVRIITNQDARQLIESLKHHGYGVTTVAGEGATGKVHIVFTVIPRKELSRVEKLIEDFGPKTFWSVETVQHAEEGVFPQRRRTLLPILSWPGSSLSPDASTLSQGEKP
ncbi:MAG: DUF2179 domain-containing protein [Gemmatales bacterium]|nr:DUF2179 domain-containing protein [Gemmatales bacterium]MDW8385941.1 DUF2179 domain-containing protein [Gemmatales bacterium]